MKLHIGPGKAYLPGWVNVDILSTTHCDVYSNALALPYPRGSFFLIYASHVLEHFNRHLILAALTHWRDLLIPGSILRLAVPDFNAIVKQYLQNRKVEELIGLLYGGQDSHFNEHHIVFDEASLTRILQTVGFTNVREWDWHEVEHGMYDDYSQAYLPSFDKEKGRLMSLNLEAEK